MNFMKIYKILLILFLLTGQTVLAQKWLNLQKKDGLADDYIKKVCVYKNELWIGTPSGITVYNLKTGKMQKYNKSNSLPHDFVNDIYIDEANVWVATANGLARYDKKQKKWSSYSKKDGLSDNFITAIYADNENYWFGTQYWGVSVYAKNTSTIGVYTAIDGLADNKINCINGIGNEIWFGTKGGISQLKYYEFLWKIFTSANTEFGLARDSVISLTVDGDDVWCGTEGEGICKFNTYSERWQQFNTGNQLLDDFILSMAKDGENIWVGTFGGIARYNKYRNTWENFGERKELPEPSITSIAVDGDYIWMATAGSGVTRYKKEKPQIDISPTRSGYAANNLIKIFGTVFDYDGISKINISFRKRNENLWYDSGIKIKKQDNIQDGLIADWNTSGLVDGEYIIKLDAFDRKGNFNSTESVFKIDTVKPIIYLDKYNTFINASKLNLTGTYFEDNLTYIQIQPGNRTAAVDKLLKTFNLPLSLNDQENKFTLTAYDIARQSTSIPVVIIKDTRSPQISIEAAKKVTVDKYFKLNGSFKEENIDVITIQPFDMTADLNLKLGTFSKTLVLEEGKNNIICTAVDKAGNKTAAAVSITYQPLKDPLVLSDLAAYVNTRQKILQGKVIYKNIDKISAELNNKKIELNYSRKNLSINTKLQLKEGKNYLTFYIVDDNDNQSLIVREIICDTTAPGIEFISFPEYTKDKTIEIKGRYTEANLQKLLFNGREVQTAEARQDFSISLKLSQKQTPVKISILDKAGQQKDYQKTIVLDDVAPKISSLDYARTVNQKQVTLKGRFLEENMAEIRLSKGKLLKKNKNDFTAGIELEEGENKIQLSLFDKSGLSMQTNITIDLDQDEPEFELAELPDTVNDKEVVIQGVLESKDIREISVQPGNKKMTIKEDKFFGSVPLLQGKNTIVVTAKDYAGNSSQVKETIECRLDTQIIDKDMMLISKKEYQELQKKQQTVKIVEKVVEKTVGNVPEKEEEVLDKIDLPRGSSLVLAPYYTAQGDSLWRLSKRYYGSTIYADYIQKVNELINPLEIRRKGEIFMPTPKLIRNMARADDKDFEKILSLITLIRYDYGYYSDIRQYNEYLGSLLHNYGFKHEKLFSNYNQCIYLINNENILIFSRAAPDINNIRQFRKKLDAGPYNVLLTGHYKNRITFSYIKNYNLK